MITLENLCKTYQSKGKDIIAFATNAEFAGRPDGLRPMQEGYGFEFGRPKVKRITAGLTYQALKDEQDDISLFLSTDGSIPTFDFHVLEDNKDFSPLVRSLQSYVRSL